MRYMSFALTVEPMQRGEKDITRRIGWRDAKPGWTVQPARKCQGLKKGQRIEKITRPIVFVDVRLEPLEAITPADVVREGFPGMTPFEFVTMFRQHNKCLATQEVVRIAFQFAPPRPRLTCRHGNDRDLCLANECNANRGLWNEPPYPPPVGELV
jgi:hypothetical protein